MGRPSQLPSRRAGFSGAVLAAVALAVLLAACSPRPALFADTHPGDAATPPRIQALQGDILVIDGRHVRLADMAAPQPAPDARCIAEALAARQARLRLQQLALGVRQVEILPTGAHDSDNRVEAHVRFDGQDPGDVLIEEGLAVTQHGAHFDWCGPVSEALPQGRHITMLSLSGS
ncbi:MAG TPA: nuclease [Phenylobacterium sp.]|jgi:endonuclease YncB( thermonuclease family)|uniref:thermonuclease family protein n=1 Tax=Phenylobacterium sp. TaxID=1871053 RepID=UPI002CEB83F6|nr:nuclease [Phenylobacterium sp.]HXA40579.1 nuclease [Phenylobacterium sp.]